MELKVTGKNIELTPQLREYIEKKLGKLSRHLPDILEAKVEVSEEKTRSPQTRYVIQVTINSNGTILRGEERGDDFFVAIDKVADVMDRQIERFKGRRSIRKGVMPTVRNPDTLVQPAPEAEEDVGRIVKIKKFVVKPMTIDEAIEQMELLGHDFFLFLNSDGGRLNLLYRRKDKNYGLIEPEIG